MCLVRIGSTLAGMFSKSAMTAVCDMLCMVKYTHLTCTTLTALVGTSLCRARVCFQFTRSIPWSVAPEIHNSYTSPYYMQSA